MNNEVETLCQLVVILKSDYNGEGTYMYVAGDDASRLTL